METSSPTTQAAEAHFSVQAQITLRPARADDLPRLEWFGEYTHYRLVFAHAYQEQTEGQRLLLLADFNGFPIGQLFILFAQSSRPRHGYLYAFRVMPAFRGQQIGTRLVTEAERILRAAGYRRAVIAVAQTNDGALRLYRRLGYTIFKEDPGMWHYTNHLGRTVYVNEPAWMLEKKLQA